MKKLSKYIKWVLIIVTIFFTFQNSFSQQRFPKPEFENGYVQPDTTTPSPRAIAMEYIDVFILLSLLSLAAWFVLKKRSRNGIFWISLFTLLYFGFYREGCVCTVGSIQNVALTVFNSVYTIPITVLLFFLLPLFFSLFFGRVFCAGVCPLGVIQDLIILKPLSIPVWVRRTLGLIPFIYLGLAVLFAATDSDFIICRYDPFVGFFRLDGPFNMIILGIAFLVIGLFVARPYCRFLCPYGALLKITSYFSKYHLSITPKDCIECKLCTNSCPFDAIETPTNSKFISNKPNQVWRFIFFAALIPLWIFIGGYAMSQMHRTLALAHPNVYLTRLLTEQPELIKDTKDIEIQTFLSSGKTMDTLVSEAQMIEKRYYKGGWWLGSFLGLVFGWALMNQAVFRKRTGYKPNKSDCYSCGRCMNYCPVKK